MSSTPPDYGKAKLGLVSSSIERIEKLLKEDSLQSLIYAALECRLAIEFICYDRLRFDHDYLSNRDLRKWTPSHVIQSIIDEVYPDLDTDSSLYISKQPVNFTPTKEQFENFSYIKVGDQTAYNPKKIARFWQALSNAALHVQVPREKSDEVSVFGDEEKIRRIVNECVEQLQKFDGQSIMMSNWSKTVTYECDCGLPIKRPEQTLQDGKTLHCVSPSCKESYVVTIEDDEIFFTRRMIEFDCLSCKQRSGVPQRIVEELKTDSHLPIKCPSCEGTMIVCWKLSYASISKAQ